MRTAMAYAAGFAALAGVIGSYALLGVGLGWFLEWADPYLPGIPPGDYRIVGWVALTALLAFLAGQVYQQWRDR